MSAEVRRLRVAEVRAADVFEELRYEPDVAFLDSALPQKMGRWSIIGLNPYTVLEDREGRAYQDGQPAGQDFMTRLEELLRAHRAPNPTPLPLISGAIGYLSYDFGRRFEHIETRHPRETGMPDARFVFYDNFLIEDRETGQLYATAEGVLAEPRASLDAIEAMVREVPPAPVPVRGSRLAPYSSRFTREEYEHAVDAMTEYMAAGDVYVANMTQTLVAPCEADSYDVYRYLRTYNPAPMAAYLEGEDWAVCCASMERFLKVEGGMVETRPIKGTRPRGATPEEDRRNREELERSEKDHSELLMIVDLERNDLSAVCEPGSVQVTDQFAIEDYATVFHLVSTVRGRLAASEGVADLLRAAFPGGSITGAPKIRAMQIIDELERCRRGLYTGSIGYLSTNGDCDLNIVIRTAVIVDGLARVGAGGGITYESDHAFEYEETLQKAKAVLEAVAEGGES